MPPSTVDDPEPPVYGPYNFVHEAGRDAAPHGIAFPATAHAPDYRGPLPGGEEWRAYDELKNTCRLAAVELGDFDRRILEWLSRWDPATGPGVHRHHLPSQPPTPEGVAP